MASKAVDFLRTLRGTTDSLSLPSKSQSQSDSGVQKEAERLADTVVLGSTKYLVGQNLTHLRRDQLKAHLIARKVDAEGTKAELIARLKQSLDAEVSNEECFRRALDEEARMLVDLEERGSVYVVGTNACGQLGLGDLEPRRVFTVVPDLRGMGICFVSAANEITFAVNEDHGVFVFGSFGLGPTANFDIIPEEVDPDMTYASPVYIDRLKGESIVQVAPGASHAIGRSDGGDVFVWGHGAFGRLGLGTDETRPRPTLLTKGLPPEATTTQIACGQNHSALLTNQGGCYCWGHLADGRLGLGVRQRVGAKDAESRYYPMPTLVPDLKAEFIVEVACGSEHTIARSREGVLWSWGSGSGGKLGLGDMRDRYSPEPITQLAGSTVTSISCGSWHSVALVHIPPLLRGCLVYTWGSGYSGQLGQGTTLLSLTPAVVEYLLEEQVYATAIACGSHHNAIIDLDGEMWTWGSNKFNCLGREIEDKYVNYSATPGFVSGFGTIVHGVGRGMPRSVCCGREYTVVATYPYTGPTLEVAREIEEERQRRALELAHKTAVEENIMQRRRQQRATIMKQAEANGRLCLKCKECAGFTSHPIKPNLCVDCGHSAVLHTIDSSSLDSLEGRQLTVDPIGAMGSTFSSVTIESVR